MRAPLAKTLIGAASTMLAVALLAGCTSTSSSPPTASASPSPTPTATSTAAAKPVKSDDVLFTISANVRGKDGSTIAIRMTTHKPIPYSDSDVEPLQKEFLAACGAGVGGQPVTPETLAMYGSILMSIDLESSVKGKPFVYPLDTYVGQSNFGQSAKGAGITATEPTFPCHGNYTWSTSGSAHAVADFESGIPGPDPTMWRYAYYGFSVPFDSKATIEACRIELKDAATKVVSGINGWDPNAPQSGTTCGIGYSGE